MLFQLIPNSPNIIKKSPSFQTLPETLILDPQNQDAIAKLIKFNKNWENQYDALRQYQHSHGFKIPAEEAEEHLKTIRGLIERGSLLHLLNIYQSRQPGADPHCHTICRLQLTGLKALKISENAFNTPD